MIDIHKIRTEPEEIKKHLLKRLPEGSFDLEKIIVKDDERKSILAQLESFRAERNKNSKIKPTEEVILQMKKIGEDIKRLEEELKTTETELKNMVSELPNITADDVVAGGKENNQVLQQFGKKPNFSYEAKDHVSLATELGIIDYERGTKMSGSGFWAYVGKGAQLEWALLNYFKAFHDKNKYLFLLLPYLLTEESAYTSGHLPKFRDDLYWTQDNLCLNATSEMMLGNYHRDEILDEKCLPARYYAFSTCFRREAGSYRKEERGMVRGHQFNKIEMFQFTKPQKSWEAFDELLKNAEKLVDGLGLHFQTVQLAAGDASAAMAKTVDIEVWIPSMEIYKEVSSVSNALDYQARRGNIRYKNSQTGENEFVHTLNASGLATSRLVPAILEQFQQKDGSVVIPKVLQKYCDFKKIEPHQI